MSQDAVSESNQTLVPLQNATSEVEFIAAAHNMAQSALNLYRKKVVEHLIDCYLFNVRQYLEGRGLLAQPSRMAGTRFDNSAK